MKIFLGVHYLYPKARKTRVAIGNPAEYLLKQIKTQGEVHVPISEAATRQDVSQNSVNERVH